MLNKQIALLALFCLLISTFQLKAQEQSAFTIDTSKFIEQLSTQFQKVGDADADEAKIVLAAYTNGPRTF